uniref:Uncharacterized protein n=1 Tax=Cucumis melo TaxID=3656 RepID=A0A9I9DYH2_CUCME
SSLTSLDSIIKLSEDKESTDASVCLSIDTLVLDTISPNFVNRRREIENFL